MRGELEGFYNLKVPLEHRDNYRQINAKIIIFFSHNCTWQNKICEHQVQEFRTGATRGSIETQHAKEEVKKLRSSVTDLRDRLAELETKVF